MLYADAANPTSNGIYESLGFRRRATTTETTLVRPSATGDVSAPPSRRSE